MTLRFVLCAEDILSATLARDLCDRVVAERAQAEWLRALWSPEHRDTQRRWTGLDEDPWWSDRHFCDRRAERAGIAGHFRVRETGRLKAFHGVAGLAYRTVKLVATIEPPPDLLVLAGDTDGQEDPERLRRAGVEGAAESLPVVVAEPVREAEAWVVAGFVPANEAEHGRLRAIERELGFDPTLCSERLMSAVTGDRRDAKRVCRALLGADHVSPHDERARACWLDTPLDVLAAHGRRNGLAEYLAEVERVLLPRLGDEGRRG